MAAKDNTLGAPTEGLGQTVTFTASGGVGVPQLQIPDRGAVRMGTQGGAPTSSGQARQVQAAQPDPTMAALMKLGGSLLAPAVKREQEAQFMQGVVRASQEEAIKEIVDEQPWYSKLFGSTSLVDGARAQTSQSKAYSVMATMEADMANLRKLDSKAMAAYSQKLLADTANTGDAATDQLIRSSVLQALPTTLKAQAKEHLRYQQEVFLDTRGSMVDAGAKLLQEIDKNLRNPDSTRELPDVLEVKRQLTEAIARPDGVDEATFNKEVVNRAAGQILQGNFAVHDFLKETGFVEKLTPAQQVTLSEARQRAQVNARAQLPIEFLQKEAQWRALSADPDNKPEMIVQLGKELTEMYVKATGDNTDRYFSNAQYVQEFGQLEDTKRREAARLAREAEQDRERRIREAAAAQGVKVNPMVQDLSDIQQGMHMRDMKPADRKMAWKELNASVSQQELQMIRANQAQVGIYDTEFKDAMNISVRAALQTNDPLKLEAAYQKYWVATINSSGDLRDTVALAYADKDVAEVMTRYHKMAGSQPADANTIAIRYTHAALPQGTKLDTAKGSKDKADLGVLQDGIVGKGLLALGRIAGGDKFPLENPSQVLSWIKGNRNEALEDDDAESRVTTAIKKTEGLTVIGGFGILRSAKATSIDDYWSNRRPGEREVDKHAPAAGNKHHIFRAQVDKTKAMLGIDTGLQVVQAPDINGVPRFVVSGLDKQGNAVHQLFTADEAAANYKAMKTAPRTVKNPLIPVRILTDVATTAATQLTK